jgi:Flp pilus assembly protein TadB
MPPALAGVLCLVSPAHMKLLISDSLGLQMLAFALVLQVAGTLVIRKLVNVPY